MKKLSVALVAVALCVSAWGLLSPSRMEGNTAPVTTQPTAEASDSSLFEEAVQIIKKYETLHSPKHWPLVGYGHKVLPGETFNRKRALSEKEADALLRKDLLKNCAVFRDFGPDSLLLGVLAYNIGSGATLRSSVVRKLRAGDRDIESAYLAHSRYRGKVHNQIRQRRIEEFEALFINDNTVSEINSELMASATSLLYYKAISVSELNNNLVHNSVLN